EDAQQLEVARLVARPPLGLGAVRLGPPAAHLEHAADRLAEDDRHADDVVELERLALAIDGADAALIGLDARAELEAVAEAGDPGHPPRILALQLDARIVEQDGPHLRRHEVVGARQHLAQVLVEPHLEALEVAIATRAHEEARDLLGRQRQDRLFGYVRHGRLGSPSRSPPYRGSYFVERGSSTVKVLPEPGAEATRTSPPWRRTISRVMYRPSPRPPLWRVAAVPRKNGVNRRLTCSASMPMPRSTTSTTARSPTRPRRTTMSLPAGE